MKHVEWCFRFPITVPKGTSPGYGRFAAYRSIGMFDAVIRAILRRLWTGITTRSNSPVGLDLIQSIGQRGGKPPGAPIYPVRVQGRPPEIGRASCRERRKLMGS